MGVACRVRAFADPKVVRSLSSDYIPATASLNKLSNWVDDDSRFVARIRKQAPARPQKRSGGQGMYMVTADGHLLYYCSSFMSMRNPKSHLDKGLKAWRELAPARRRPNAIRVPAARKLNRVAPPRNGLVLRVYSRQLDRQTDGKYVDAKSYLGRGDEASIDSMWLTESEWKSLIPKRAVKGHTFPIQAALVRRLAQRHLIDQTRGNLRHWKSASIKSARLKATVVRVTRSTIEMRLDGTVRISGAMVNSTVQLGYEPTLGGLITCHRRSGKLQRFDLVAIGDQWGKLDIRAREGRNPLGVAFELSKGNAPRDLVPPGGIEGSGFNKQYFGTPNPR